MVANSLAKNLETLSVRRKLEMPKLYTKFVKKASAVKVAVRFSRAMIFVKLLYKSVMNSTHVSGIGFVQGTEDVNLN